MIKNSSHFYEALGLPLLQGGYEPLPIKPGDKIPRIKEWASLTIDEDQVQQWAGNGKARHFVGIRTGRAVGIDVDIDDAQVTRFVRDDAALMLGDSPVRFGKPGRALLMYGCSGEEGRKKRVVLLDTQGQEHAIEVLQRGQQFVAFGIHPDTRKPYQWEGGDPLDTPIEDLPQITDVEISAWLDSVAARVCDQFGWTLKQADTFDEDERFLLSFRPQKHVEAMRPEERVQHEAMQNFDAWVPVIWPEAKPYQGGYRVSSETLGRDLQEDLSLHPSGIKDHGLELGMTPLQVVSQWVTSGDEDAALVWLAEKVGVDLELQKASAKETEVKESPLGKWQGRIQSAESAERLKRVAGGIARDRTIDVLDRETLAGVFQRRMKEITQQPISIASVRKTLRPVVSRTREEGESDQPDWCKGWYYVTTRDELYQYGSEKWLSAAGFDASYRREIAPNDEGIRPSALRVALDDFNLPVVEVGMYCPQFGERFTIGGRECVNIFNPQSLPKEVDVLSPEDLACIDRVERHLINISGNRKHVATALMDWLAYNVQQPGHKIRFSPLIKGIEGDGKSLIMDILAACLGDANTRTIGPAVVLSNFNGFAQGSCVVGLEELRMVGHSRHDAANAVKPLITNDTIDLHRKGLDSYNILNVTNYIAFTNHADAVPISDTDRRWFVVFTPWYSEKTMQDFVNEPLDTYFKELFAAIRRPGVLRRWLLDMQISAAFDPNGRAPMTPEKLSMRQADADDEETAVATRLIMGGEGITENVIAVDCLRNIPTGSEFDLDDVLQIPSGRTLARVLQKMGWTYFPKLVKWKGKPRRVWVKGIRLDDQGAVRQHLDRSDSGSGLADWFG